MVLKITDFAMRHLVDSVEVTMGRASLEKREARIDKVLDETQVLITNPNAGQAEVWLEGRDHVFRRLVIGNFKVIYRIENEVIYVTDIFDSRQDPKRMRG